MDEEISTFGDIEIEKQKFYLKNFYFLEVVNTDNILVSYKRKNINTLLVTCMIIIKLNHYI